MDRGTQRLSRVISAWRALACLTIVVALLGPAPALAQRVVDTRIIAYEFPSGLRAVVARTPAIPGRSPRVYVTSYVAHGSLREGRLGRSHLIEHIAANTPAPPDLPAPPAGLETFAANALTKPNFLSFVRTVSPDGLEASIFNRLARVGQAVPNDAVYTKEHGRVIEELEKSITRSPDFVAWKALEAHANGKLPSLAEELQSVRTEVPELLYAEMRRAFVPDNAVLVVAGDVDPAAAMAIVKRAAARLGLAERRPESKFPTGRGLRLNQPARTIAQNPADIYVTAVGLHQPDPADAQYPAFLVLDQLVMGGRNVGDDGASVARSGQSPLGFRLGSSLRATNLWDGREQSWGVAPWAEGPPGLWAFVFRTPAATDPRAVSAAIGKALRDVRANAMSDGEIIAARDKLAAFYETWLFEPSYRILGDHLAAFAFAGLDPADVTDIPASIRKVSPASVRRMMDWHVLPQKPLIVSTIPWN